MPDDDPTAAPAASPDDIRAAGWLVAIHNDYIMDGRRHTFWLFTNNATGRFVKGEDTTDARALNWVRRMIGLPERPLAARGEHDAATPPAAEMPAPPASTFLDEMLEPDAATPGEVERLRQALEQIAREDYEPIGESFTLAAAKIAAEALAATAPHAALTAAGGVDLAKVQSFIDGLPPYLSVLPHLKALAAEVAALRSARAPELSERDWWLLRWALQTTRDTYGFERREELYELLKRLGLDTEAEGGGHAKGGE